MNLASQRKEPLQVKPNQNASYLFAKRAFDIVASFCGLIVFSPVFLMIAIALKLEGPKEKVFFKHKRFGQNGKDLYIYKFRSMVSNANELLTQLTPEQQKEWENNFKLDDDPRLTRFGKILRKTSLDELPQLLNILQGSLSTVGPRPIIAKELEKYGDNKAKFLSAKPGLTGYWQAYARSNCPYEQRMEMELYYVDHASFWWDLKIIFATVSSVLSGKGAK